MAVSGEPAATPDATHSKVKRRMALCESIRNGYFREHVTNYDACGWVDSIEIIQLRVCALIGDSRLYSMNPSIHTLSIPSFPL